MTGEPARLRSIPARAGEPYSRPVTSSLRRVYPRACGGTVTLGQRLGYHLGLSPRVRGNRSLVRPLEWPHRSIPARAGEPGGTTANRYRGKVYPRACGGTDFQPGPASPRHGLSPRVRGNRPGRRSAERRSRSIPARAGEPRLSSALPPQIPVYPRACGGTSTVKPACAGAEGLSPRVRGNPMRLRATARLCGSIPARAGEPLFPICATFLYEVYPRACGGTFIDTLLKHIFLGLSPRVRGNRLVFRGVASILRSIPARAGEPKSESTILKI